MPSLTRALFAAPKVQQLLFASVALGAASCGPADANAPAAQPAPQAPVTPPPSPSVPAATGRHRVIVFVWDGLRADSVSEELTPNLAKLRDQDGVDFADHHSVYPTFTMMNSASLATGAYPGRHGFFGNTEYQPGPKGQNADGKPVDFSQPVFTEDYGVLQALDTYYREHDNSRLLKVGTLYQAAEEAGLRTAVVGKTGAAFLQNYALAGKQSVLLDENIAVPLSFAHELQNAGFSLPQNAPRFPYANGESLTLLPDNGNPSAASGPKFVLLKDGVTSDPRAALGSPHNERNAYLMKAYLGYVLPKLDPELSFVWLRNPDTTEHQFGPGSPNYVDALRHQDQLLGELQAKLKELGRAATTDVIVVSDHGHSTVNGDAKLFPLRALKGNAEGNGELGDVDASGFPVSGEVRTADLLQRSGFKHVFDGAGCHLDPILSGIRANGSSVLPTLTDASGRVCGSGGPPKNKGEQTPATKYTTGDFKAPEKLPADAIVIAANGGSEYFYVPTHENALVRRLVQTLQEHRVYGAVFVRKVYGEIPGTLPLSLIQAEGEQAFSTTPDVIVSFDWDAAATVGGYSNLPGIEYASALRNRGMHGSFSPRDVHNTLIASGPDFKSGFHDDYPSGNVDLAPTIAHLLGLSLKGAQGRVLSEALIGQNPVLRVEPRARESTPAPLKRVCEADDPNCARPGKSARYSFTLGSKVLTLEDKTQYEYFDMAKATRE